MLKTLAFRAPVYTLRSEITHVYKQQLVRHVHRVMFDTDKVYIWRKPGEERFHVSLQVKNDELGLNKVFNWNRMLEESVEKFTEKINVSITEKLAVRVKKLQKKNKDVQVPDVNSAIFFNDEKIGEDFVCENFFNEKHNGQFILKFLKQEYRFVINSPWIEKLTLSPTPMAGFPVYPVKLEGYFIDRKQCDFIWEKSLKSGANLSFDAKFEECGQGYYYIVKNEDVNHILRLRCIPKNEIVTGPQTDAMTNVVSAVGPVCPFESRHKFTLKKVPADELRVVSYNILADMYADSKDGKTILFSYCIPYALKIEYRILLILKELIGYNADLICLQEVDKKVFDRHLSPFLETHDLQGIFTEKLLCGEGLACFYDPSKLKLMKSEFIVLGLEIEKNPLFQDIWNKIKSNENLLIKIKERNNVVTATVFESLSQPGEVIVVGNLHLYFHPDADIVRLLQGIASFIYIQDVMKRTSAENPGKNVSFILCGDFNSTPDCGLYQFMTQGSVGSDHKDWKNNEAYTVEDPSFSHPLRVASACGTPEYTNYTEQFKACLDYIYHQTDRLEVKQVVPFPSNAELALEKGIPSTTFPSDHIALVADLKWRV